MDQFSDMKPGGILKDDYGNSGISEALKKKREKLAQTKLGLLKDEEDDNQHEQ